MTHRKPCIGDLLQNASIEIVGDQKKTDNTQPSTVLEIETVRAKHCL